MQVSDKENFTFFKRKNDTMNLFSNISSENSIYYLRLSHFLLIINVTLLYIVIPLKYTDFLLLKFISQYFSINKIFCRLYEFFFNSFNNFLFTENFFI